MQRHREKENDLARHCSQKNANRAEIHGFVEYFSGLVYKTIQLTFKRFNHFQNDDIAEVYQEVFKALFDNDRKALKEFNPKKALFTTYLIAITRNKSIKYLQKFCKPTEEFCENITELNGTTEDISEFEYKEKLNVLHSMLIDLTTKEKLFYKLYFTDMVPEDEIADILGIDKATVYSKKAKLVNKLKKARVEKEITPV